MRIRVSGGRVLDPAQGVDEVVDVVIDDGRVAGFVAGTEGGDFDLHIDARNLVVAPGFVDLHTHLREPGFEDKETVASGGQAAVAGGFTTICCMPNTHPTLDTAGDIEFVFAAARRARKARATPLGTVTNRQLRRETAV